MNIFFGPKNLLILYLVSNKFFLSFDPWKIYRFYNWYLKSFILFISCLFLCWLCKLIPKYFHILFGPWIFLLQLLICISSDDGVSNKLTVSTTQSIPPRATANPSSSSPPKATTRPTRVSNPPSYLQDYYRSTWSSFKL